MSIYNEIREDVIAAVLRVLFLMAFVISLTYIIAPIDLWLTGNNCGLLERVLIYIMFKLLHIQVKER